MRMKTIIDFTKSNEAHGALLCLWITTMNTACAQYVDGAGISPRFFRAVKVVPKRSTARTELVLIKKPAQADVSKIYFGVVPLIHRHPLVLVSIYKRIVNNYKQLPEAPPSIHSSFTYTKVYCLQFRSITTPSSPYAPGTTTP